MFVPDRVKVPLPVFVNPPAPESTPLYVVLVLAPPAVSVNPPFTMLPAPAIDPTVSAPPRVKVAPPATLNAEASVILSAALVVKPPALMVVAPV